MDWFDYIAPVSTFISIATLIMVHRVIGRFELAAKNYQLVLNRLQEERDRLSGKNQPLSWTPADEPKPLDSEG